MGRARGTSTGNTWPATAAGGGAAAAIWLLRHGTSPAVKAWNPPAGHRLPAGPLSVRELGSGSPATVLLHGLTGSGDWFGAGFDPLADHGRLVVPDLLGFGRSMDLARQDFSLDAHVAALDEMLDDLGLAEEPLTVVGHSMGAVLALHWASRRPNTARVVALCAPLYRSRDEAARHIARMGLLEKLFALETPTARLTCAFMCEYRGLAQWISVAVSPQWPVPLARQGVLHSWESYLGGMNGIIQRPGWEEALQALDGKEVPVLLVNGANDPVPVRGRAEELADRFASVHSIEHPVAGHDLPASYPAWCTPLIRQGPVRRRVTAGRTRGSRRDRERSRPPRPQGSSQAPS